MDNVIGFDKKEKTYYSFDIIISYMDGTSEEIECTFFGMSVDNPRYMIFSNAHPDDTSDETDIPDLMINSDNVKSIRTVATKKLAR